MKQHVHIVSPEVPFPLQQGELIDVYCTLKHLHRHQVDVTLHCFHSPGTASGEVESFCREVYYYDRHEGHKGFSLHLPYSVGSRQHDALSANLNRDQDPICFEGLSTTYCLYNGHVKDRKIILRYWQSRPSQLDQHLHDTHSWLRKLYYLHEKKLSHGFEHQVMQEADTVLAVSDWQSEKLRQSGFNKSVHTLTPFVPWDFVTSETGLGSFCLFHGNLEAEENERMAIWLLEEVVNDLEIPFVIAGRKPSARLKKLAHRQMHTCLVADPGEKEMQDLIRKAHIHVLPAKHVSPVRIKLINSLYCGRHVVVNEAMVKGTHLEEACHVASSAQAFKSILTQLFHQPFTHEEIPVRERLLRRYYNNDENVQTLMRHLFHDV